jgi:prephenate dehydratase
MAIENTIAGSILMNYRLIKESKLRIIGEVYLRIQQNLMALPGEKIQNLQEVHSHPVAIEQCRKFFRQHPHIRLIETEDTALSAKNIWDNQLRGVGAIASEIAAEMYQMEILAHSIETNKHNYTRFLLLQPIERSKLPPESDKVSLCFAVDHIIGSLHKVLAVLSAYHANLTKIESAPIIGKPWEYLFFLDFVMDGDLTYQQAIEAIRPITHDLKVLGIYKQGKHFD